MENLNFPVAFGAGVLAFFAPCIFPLLPAFIGYVTGVSAGEINKGKSLLSKKVILNSLFYVAGFSIIFVLLGAAAGGVGIFFRRYADIVQRLGGAIIIVFGLQFSGMVTFPFFTKERKFNLPLWAEKLSYLRSFLVGVVFATAWTPCIGAILGSILTLAVISGTAVRGSLLLFVYSLGISLPFLLVSFTLALAPRYISFLSKRMGVISRISGLMLTFLGLLLLTDTYRFLNAWFFEIAFKLGYQIK